MRRLVGWLWQHEFAWRLSRASGSAISRATLNAGIDGLPPATMPGRDAASHFNRRMAQSLHAAANHLERDMALPRPDAVRIARAAFVASGSWLSRAAVRLWLRLERDPFRGIERRGVAALARRLWGEVSLCVRDCPFQTYFWNAARPDLTPVLCAWDTGWTDAVNASPRPVSVRIRSTLATGGARCEFAFRKTASPDDPVTPSRA